MSVTEITATCVDCGRIGRETTHKGDRVLACPDCEAILYRAGVA